jgi:hypothetical protein
VPLIAALIAATIATSVAPVRLSAGPEMPADAVADRSQLRPLTDVHELMEHVVATAFENAKSGLAEKPADAKSWRAVRDVSLLLGETGNLLLIRKPDAADEAEWTKLSIAMREAGDALTNAAKAKDYDSSLRTYRALVQSCNQCHAVFGDDGEPKIEP